MRWRAREEFSILTHPWTVLVGVGLLYLTYSKREGWKAQRSELHAWPATTIFWILSLVFIIIAPFFRNTTITPSIPWYVMPTVGVSVLMFGGLYWVGWAKIWPMFGYAIQHQVEELPDGSEVVKFVVSYPSPLVVPLLTFPSLWCESAHHQNV